MKFCSLKSKRKIIKSLSYAMVVMMSLVSFVPVSAQGEALNAGAPSKRGVQPIVYTGNNEKVTIPGCFSLKYDNPTANPEINYNGINVSETDIKDIKDNLSFSYYKGNDVNDNENSLCDWTMKEASKFKVAYVEVKGADGYDRYDYSTKDFTDDQELHSPINASGKYPTISHVVFYFKLKTPAPKGNIEITKKWMNGVDNIQTPEGYKIDENFVLLQNGQPVEVQKNVTNGVLTMSNIAPGNYELAELNVPGYTPEFEGYTKYRYGNNGWLIYITVNGNFTAKVTVTNNELPDPKGSIEVTKLWDNGGSDNKAPADYEIDKNFVLLQDSNIVNVAKSVKDGVLTFSNIVPGDYELAELENAGYAPKFKEYVDGKWVVQSPTAYGETGSKISIKVVGDEKLLVEVTNKKDTPPPEIGSITVNKKWVDFKGNTITTPPDTKLNLLFTLTNLKGGTIAQYNISDDNKVINFPDLGYDTYTLTEENTVDFTPEFEVNDVVQESTKTIDGKYQIKVAVDGDHKAIAIGVVNRKAEPKGTITVNKSWHNFLGDEISSPDINLNELITLNSGNTLVSGDLSKDNKTLTFTNLDNGMYLLKETKYEDYTPEFKVNGEYVAATSTLDGWQIELNINENIKEIAIDIVNTKAEPKGEITVNKKWVDFKGNEISGPNINLSDIFTLQRVDLEFSGNQEALNIIPLSSNNSSIIFNDLSYGHYILTEKELPGYKPTFIVNGESQEPEYIKGAGWELMLSVSDDATAVKVDVTNKEDEPKGNVTVNKKWVDYKGSDIIAPDIPLNELFTLTKKEVPALVKSNSEIKVNLSTKNDYINFSNLENGTYILTENMLEGYTPTFSIGNSVIPVSQNSKGQWYIEFVINSDTKNISFDVTNKKVEPKGGITVEKTWLDSNGKNITGPVGLLDLFTLKDSKGNVITGAALKDGMLTWESLSLGTYTLEEKDVEGYEASITLNGKTIKASKVTLTLNEDKQILGVKVANKETTKPVVVPVNPSTPLPKTDRTFGTEMLLIILGILTLGVGAVLKFRRKSVK